MSQATTTTDTVGFRTTILLGGKTATGIEVPAEPRVVAVPPDLADALRADAHVALFFDSLSYGRKKHLVLPVEDANTDDTRGRRVAKAVEMLREGRV